MEQSERQLIFALDRLFQMISIFLYRYCSHIQSRGKLKNRAPKKQKKNYYYYLKRGEMKTFFSTLLKNTLHVYAYVYTFKSRDIDV